MLEYTGAQQIYIEIKDKFRKRNNYTLNIRYTTKLGMDYEGFYVSTYTNENGDTRYLSRVFYMFCLFIIIFLYNILQKRYICHVLHGAITIAIDITLGKQPFCDLLHQHATPMKIH